MITNWIIETMELLGLTIPEYITLFGSLNINTTELIGSICIIIFLWCSLICLYKTCKFLFINELVKHK